jgi:hypothetical protein
VLTGRQKEWKKRLEQAIERIPDVYSAGIALDNEGNIAEIHLVGNKERGAKRIVRDTESLLFVNFGVQMDYRKISIVQLDAPNVTATPTRLKFIAASPEPMDGDMIQVVLEDDEDLYKGTASWPQAGPVTDQTRAAAQATMNAVQEAIGDVARLELRGVQSVPLDDRLICLVVLQAVAGTQSEFLTGTCVLRDSSLDAAAKATLDAINRRLPVWFIDRRKQDQQQSTEEAAAATTS